ncbi:hypothetical protein PV10_09084 [Exophiala mesophila]|uniref:Hyaluronan/mRNA-binding protein domain-containing protein n=1 Tax=Exophiala mesophila TaxID=212818 RepID=A0A0D1ZN05_EXOME|nr:uncharacterized protein PV10_09084 [Exophiala mesophila]KIV88163.1 hypothetical protein PV10_09084 [Exophiala mesophila]
MTDVKSKNLYELLGNTSDQDSDREPEPPTKAIDKTAPRSGKRDAPKAAPAAPTEVAGRGRGGRRGGGFSGNEAAFRDRATGRNFNREQPTGDGAGQDGYGNRGGRGPGARRGGRAQGPRRGGDRHSRTGIADHPKQEGHGWGENTGEGELADEKAGDAIASQEVKEGGFDAGQSAAWDANAEQVNLDGEAQEQEAEPEDNNKSYADYVAEQAAKKLESLGLKEARAPNEGAKENKKWKSAKELTKEETTDYFKGEDKAKRERAREAKKEFLDIDYSFKESRETTRGRGGRGGGRGRGDRGDYRGEGRGEFRGGRGGGRGRGDRGEFRGRGGRGRGSSDGPAVAVNDETAFPSLGAK